LRTARPRSARFFATAAAGVLALAGGLLGGAGYGLLHGATLAVLSAAAALAVDRLLARRWKQRTRLLERPFPEAWRRFLADQCDHYDRLPAELRRRFESDLSIFVHETRITGIEMRVEERHRLLVAASAVTLSVGWPDYEWDQLAEVLLYPHDFDRDYAFGQADLAGQAHPWGTIILSAPALEASFADPDDGFHVGVHEFGHLLDVDRTHFDGIPVGLDEPRSRQWLALMEHEMQLMRSGQSALDPYGADDPVEFLAVSLEAFFELPLLLRRRHGEIYGILAAYLGQDPAAWDDRRGLRL